MPLTPQGFEADTLEEINEAIGADQLATIANDLDIDPDEPLGQMNFIVADVNADTQSALAVAYNAFDRGSAEGRQLDVIGDLIGLPRLGAQGPRVTIRLQLTSGAVLTEGDTINPDGLTAQQWKSLQSFTATANGFYYFAFEAIDSSYSVGAGTTWDFPALPGWVSVANLAPSTPARLRESDTAYRLRQLDSLARPGASTTDALAADLRAVDGVLQANVYENDRSFEVDGLPPHSFEAVIYDGPTADADNGEIAQVIWDSKPPGSAYAFGLIDATAYDAEGQPRLVKFSRAEQLRTVISFTLQVLPGWQAAQLQTLRTAILDAFNTRRQGEDLPSLKTKSIAIAQPYAYDVTGYTQGVFPGPYADVTLVANRRQIFTLASADLTITVQTLQGAP